MKCWNCGYDPMDIKTERGHEWYECPKCHTGHVDLPKLGQPAVKEEISVITLQTKDGPVKKHVYEPYLGPKRKKAI